MRLHTIICSLVAHIVPLISATALTYKLAPNEKACFFSFVEEKGAKLAFYFAVNISLADLLAQSGYFLNFIFSYQIMANRNYFEPRRFNQAVPSMSTTAL